MGIWPHWGHTMFVWVAVPKWQVYSGSYVTAGVMLRQKKAQCLVWNCLDEQFLRMQEAEQSVRSKQALLDVFVPKCYFYFPHHGFSWMHSHQKDEAVPQTPKLLE